MSMTTSTSMRSAAVHQECTLAALGGCVCVSQAVSPCSFHVHDPRPAALTHCLLPSMNPQLPTELCWQCPDAAAAAVLLLSICCCGRRTCCSHLRRSCTAQLRHASSHARRCCTLFMCLSAEVSGTSNSGSLCMQLWHAVPHRLTLLAFQC